MLVSGKQRRRWLPTWTVPAFCWSLIGASLFLLLTLLFLRVAEFGPYGLALFLAALAIIFGRGAMLAAPHARRVKPRFSLRTLLIMTAIGGIGLAFFGNWMRDVQQQHAALDRVFAHGFGVTLLEKPLAGPMYRNFGMRGVIAIGGLNHAAKCQKHVTAEDLESLRGLRCRGVYLNLSIVSDEDIAAYRPGPGQVEFHADATGIGDKSTQHLSQFGELEVISLVGTRITDDSLRHLAKLPRLHTLSLMATSVTDDAIPHLKEMRQLRMLQVGSTSLTPEGIAELRIALPECKIR